jgi:hypothetical protein
MDKNFSTQTLLILGRNPTISIAEVRAVYPRAKICAREKEFAIFEGIETIDLKKIGGVIKTGISRILPIHSRNLKCSKKVGSKFSLCGGAEIGFLLD